MSVPPFHMESHHPQPSLESQLKYMLRQNTKGSWYYFKVRFIPGFIKGWTAAEGILLIKVSLTCINISSNCRKNRNSNLCPFLSHMESTSPSFSHLYLLNLNLIICSQMPFMIFFIKCLWLLSKLSGIYDMIMNHLLLNGHIWKVQKWNGNYTCSFLSLLCVLLLVWL